MADKRPALGRGLSALIPEAPVQAEAPKDRTLEVDLDLLAPNPFQPRLTMDDQSLDERYEIIAGERRWRAAARAGLLKVPIAVREIPDTKLLEIALIENIQRENLNPIDEALAYRRLIEEFRMTQEAVAAAVGKDRASIANYLRLLKLPDDIQHEVAIGALSMGHARALVALEDAAAVRRAAGEVLGRRLSVRDTEALVRRMSEPRAEAEPAPAKDVHTRQAEDVMKLALGTRVRIVRKGAGGQIEIDFVSEDELHRLYTYLTERR
jgi:ParB family chromosome partitioning protein